MVSAKTNAVPIVTNSPDAQKGDLLQNFLENFLRKNAEHASTQTPLGSSANITYAYVDLSYVGGNDTVSWAGAKIHVMANITLTSEVNLKYADAKVEFYGFRLYSEQGSIANLTYNLSVEKSLPWVPGSKNPSPPISGYGGNFASFSDGTIIDVNEIIGDIIGGGGHGFNCYSYPNRSHIVIGAGSIIGFEENHAQMLADFRSAQTLYIDVTRILGITCQENADPMVIPTLFDDEVLCHVELTKVGDRFGYGAYTGDEYNYPMAEVPLPDVSSPYSFQSDMSYVYVLAVILLLVCLFLFL
ncbi:MAG: hypothetical protein LBH79_06705 [Nitrososphaerota archaeon]|nr:hypothetical protein [Nitrososphaerota archaeon]